METKLVTALELGFYGGEMKEKDEQFQVPVDERASWFHAEDEEPLEMVSLDEVLARKEMEERTDPNAELVKKNKDLAEQLKFAQDQHAKQTAMLDKQIQELKKGQQAPQK